MKSLKYVNLGYMARTQGGLIEDKEEEIFYLTRLTTFDILLKDSYMRKGRIAQLVRAPVSHAGGQRFDSSFAQMRLHPS